MSRQQIFEEAAELITEVGSNLEPDEYRKLLSDIIELCKDAMP